jgi:hypothetical protein
MECPFLAPVPNFTHELTLKATQSGVLFLKQNRFLQRYTGNKFSAVDINGKLWLRRSELAKEVRGQVDRPKRKKKARVETQAVSNSFNLEMIPEPQISDKFSTIEGPLSTVPKKLSTSKPREYRVKKREVRQRLLGFINTQKGSKELYFWTVTFPKGTPDDVAYRMYNIWLTALRQRGMLKDYLWIAERQENGTVHFHIAVPHKMSVQYANNMMRTTLRTFSKRGEIPFSVYACKRYNGVDIAKNRKTRRVTNFAIKKGTRALITYLTKYVTKNDTAFSHLAWHNSRGFSSLFTGVTFTIQEFVQHGFHQLIDRRKDKRFSTEYFIFIPWLSDPPAAITQHLYALNSYIQYLTKNKT